MSEEKESTPPQPGKHKPDFKIVILGQKDVGKTSLIFRYIHRRFTETVTTIGASFFLRRHKGKNFALWDTAGEERFSGLSALYSRDASAAILAYDVTCADSFASLKTRFLPMLSSAKDHCIYVVVGTKLDLAQPDATQIEQVDSEEAKRFALEINSHLPEESFASGIVPFFETSSKSGDGVDNLFTFIFEHLLERTEDEPAVETVNPGELGTEKTAEKKEKTCCKN